MYQSTQIPATQKKPKLLDQVRFTLKTKHYSLRTEESYIKWITRFILFRNKRHPSEMGASEVNSFMILRQRKIKTVEIIIEEGTWETNSHKIPGNKLVHIRIEYKETYLRKLVKDAEGRWDGEKKLWEMPYKEVIQLGLKNRVINVRD